MTERIHSVVETLAREFQQGKPVVNFETGTLDLVIDNQTLVRSLTEPASVPAAAGI